MVVYFGMSEKLPNLNYYDSTGQDWGFTKPYSEETSQMIDSEVRRIIDEQYERAKRILREHQDGHHQLAQVLLDREVIYPEDVEHIFGKRPWVSRSEEILNLNAAKAARNQDGATVIKEAPTISAPKDEKDQSEENSNTENQDEDPLSVKDTNEAPQSNTNTTDSK